LFPERLTKIDDLTRGDHHYLEPNDLCYYLGEYTARGGFAVSETNHLIINLKKPMDRRGRPEWRYKEQAITTAGQALRKNFTDQQLTTTPTLVPMPPSKVKGDPAYDDRMLRILQGMCAGVNADIRELLLQRQNMHAAHEGEQRPTPIQLAANYTIDEQLVETTRKLIVLFDDVLTTGAHFKAAKQVLQNRIPQAEVVGVFIARRASNTAELDFEDINA